MIVVGELAVELYSGGAYRTGDVDFINPHSKARGGAPALRGARRGGRLAQSVQSLRGPGALFLDLAGYLYTGRAKELRACVYWDLPAGAAKWD
ncbi:MAG: hypothetical protein LM577_00425 [Thermoproteaceae archaeon]|nr:hypothetical protein [Thermoproteaceae archaeon]